MARRRGKTSVLDDLMELLAWLPWWLVRERIRAGALVALLQDQPRYPYDCHALWLQTPHLPLKVRLAVDALAAALPKLMA